MPGASHLYIQTNLAAWLSQAPIGLRYGRLVPKRVPSKLARVRKAAGLARWPNNGLRHSFASYRVAAIHDAPRVAAELGHTSPQMLYSTYRELVLPEEADRYWEIAPPAEVGNLVAFVSQRGSGRHDPSPRGRTDPSRGAGFPSMHKFLR
jgi:hypothetical protein